MSRTHVHAPFWVIRNRAAEKDPFNNIDHDHKPRAQWKHERVEEQYEDYENYVYRTLHFPRPDGTIFSYDLTSRRKVVKTRTRWKRTFIGYTSEECDYAPLKGTYPRVKHSEHTDCEPSWHVGSKKHGRYSYYWHAGWGKSYRDEKDAYWGGARSEQRQQQQRWAKEYNSGESLEDADDYLGYEEDHSFPFWW
jgi:hypothetical protein